LLHDSINRFLLTLCSKDVAKTVNNLISFAANDIGLTVFRIMQQSTCKVLYRF
jgi:hypothetical protein